jgi:hypothetical protein
LWGFLGSRLLCWRSGGLHRASLLPFEFPNAFEGLLELFFDALQPLLD